MKRSHDSTRRQRASKYRGVAALLGCAVLLSGWDAAAADPEPVVTDGVEYRVRVTRLTPEQPATIGWRYGGEGLGGDPVRGNVTRERPTPPAAPGASVDLRLTAGDLALADGLEQALQQPEEPDRVVVEGDVYNEVYLMPNVWSRWNPIRSFGGHRGNLSLTFGAVGHRSNVYVHGVDLEFEFRYGDRLLKRFTVEGGAGNALGIMVPFHHLRPDGTPKPEFDRDVGSLRAYVHRKRDTLKETPWMDRPVPLRYAISTDCYGFGTGGYSIRTSDPATFEAEIEILRLIGFNATANLPELFFGRRTRREGIAAELDRSQQTQGGGYPVSAMGHVLLGPGVRKPAPKPGDGCPHWPGTVSNLTSAAETARVAELLDRVRSWGVDQVWARTVDEIGSVFDGAPEGKAHQGSCPYCREAFRDFVRADGRALEDFGATSWDDIRSTYGYWTRTYWDCLDELTTARDRAQAVFEAKNEELVRNASQRVLGSPGDETANAVIDQLLQTIEAPAAADGGAGDTPSSGSRDDNSMAAIATALKSAKDRLEAFEWSGKVMDIPAAEREERLSPEGRNLLWYYSARFNNEAGARTFTHLRDAYAAANERKRQALTRGETDSPEVLQPWIYAFALRGNTFLMSGHSLDFFDFYRHADTAFVYETSNRDWRVWQWDSYLCDVGRSLSRFMGLEFGLYVKAHRGAPIQRCLAAAARGVRMIYWYTYGPEYVKGDTFGGNMERLKEIAWVNRLLAGGETVTYDADWAVPAEVAVVRPLTSEYMSGSAAYENAKWVYTALMHAHIPMDALDEGLLMSEDISRYKVIVISGSHIRRDTAQRLTEWVEAGGTLITSGWGMARDEAGRPLDDLLLPVFGLDSRGAMDAWGSVPGYGATRLGAVRKQRDPPDGATVTGRDPIQGSFMPVVGREILTPRPATEIMATYADGGVAAVRHRYGQGTAWLLGTYAGVEYAWEPMITTDADQKWFQAHKRSWLAGPVLAAGVRPVVDAQGFYGIWEDAAMVEGHLLRNRQTGGLAVILINWAHHIRKPVTITIRIADAVTRAQSVALQEGFDLERRDDLLVVTLPHLDQGDILLLTP